MKAGSRFSATLIRRGYSQFCDWRTHHRQAALHSKPKDSDRISWADIERCVVWSGARRRRTGYGRGKCARDRRCHHRHHGRLRFTHPTGEHLRSGPSGSAYGRRRRDHRSVTDRRVGGVIPSDRRSAIPLVAPFSPAQRRLQTKQQTMRTQQRRPRLHACACFHRAHGQRSRAFRRIATGVSHETNRRRS